MHLNGLIVHSNGKKWVGGATEEEMYRQLKDIVDVSGSTKRLFGYGW